MRHPVDALTSEQLQELTNPQSVLGGNKQAVPWVWYDTQTYTDAVTTSLTFFQNVNQDKTLSNMQASGALPAPMYFQIYYFYVTPLIPNSNAAVNVGAWTDMQLLMQTARPTFTFTISDKKLGPFPASFFGSDGGMTGFGYNAADATAVVEEYANWGIPGQQGFCVDGSIIIPPVTGFDVTLNWAAAANLSADKLIRVSMAGTLSRKIL